MATGVYENGVLNNMGVGAVRACQRENAAPGIQNGS